MTRSDAGQNAALANAGLGGGIHLQRGWRTAKHAVVDERNLPAVTEQLVGKWPFVRTVRQSCTHELACFGRQRCPFWRMVENELTGRSCRIESRSVIPDVFIVREPPGEEHEGEHTTREHVGSLAIWPASDDFRCAVSWDRRV